MSDSRFKKSIDPFLSRTEFSKDCFIATPLHPMTIIIFSYGM